MVPAGGHDSAEYSPGLRRRWRPGYGVECCVILELLILNIMIYFRNDVLRLVKILIIPSERQWYSCVMWVILKGVSSE